QVLPWTPTGLWWRFTMANGLLVGCQAGGAQRPIFYSVTNVAETWLSLTLPAPGAAPTFNADTAGGGLTTGATYYWRVRWRHANGNSKTSPVSAGRLIGANLTANLNIPLPGAPRTDYIGWTLERTKANGSALGPFYKVADGTAATTSDGLADASLFYETDETIHGEPPVLDGVIFHKGRLVGWYGSLLYVSQPIVGEEATGIANWIGDLIYPVGKDDGDAIMTVELQADRLWIGKERSIWTFEGDDVDSFRLVQRYEGAGVAGPRAAAALGGVIMFAAGDGRFFVARGNAVEPLGAEEVGDYLDLMDFTRDREIVAKNWLGDFVFFWYVPRGKSVPTDILAYDLKFGNWSHHDNMPAVDALVQKDRTDFESASLLVADPTLLPPGNSGAVSQNPSFVVWLDKRSANWQIYVQSVDSNGAPQWTADGVQVSASTGSTTDAAWGAQVVPDGAGGCIVVFNDMRSGSVQDIYVQRYNSAGVAQYAAGGILLHSIAGVVTDAPSIAAVASDKNGGVIYLFRNANSGLFASRLNAAGAKQWGAGGTHIGITNTAFQARGIAVAKIIASTSGGCLVSWINTINTPSIRLYAQRLDPAGVAQWLSLADGLLLQTDTVSFGSGIWGGMPLCSDDNGGMIAGFRNAAGHVILHRLNSAGTKQWGVNGVAISNAPVATLLDIARDGSGGCFAAWRENVAGVYTPKLRRILSTGVPAWSPIDLGYASGASDASKTLTVVEDGFNGVLVGWDRSSGLGGVTARRVDTNGVTSWGDEVVVGSTAAPDIDSFNSCPSRLVTDGASGLIILFNDDRTAIGTVTAKQVYAGRLRSDGTMPWVSDGMPVCTATGEQIVKGACFTGAPEGEYPIGASAGYHVWSGFSGVRDRTDVNGDGGDLIPVSVTGHRYDDGLPDYVKDYDHFELYVNRGYGTIVATVSADGNVATLPLEAVSASPRYNTGLLYNTGVAYASAGRTTVGTGLPKGTEGRAASVRLTGNLESMEIGGWCLQGTALPQKDFS
ncbi:MAG TPA: hypothetical protein VJN72_14395, partial [Gaiellales bacterium]|nr:hypothetical protein [Gaiellales bacterium]